MSVASERLLMRPPRLADVPSLFRFLGDGEAMRHTHTHASLRDCRRRIALHERQRRRVGCAPWTIIERASGQIIGWGGLYLDPFDPGWGVELGYFFSPAVWGRGYASELTLVCLRLAERDLGLAAVIAFAHPANHASRRVLEKAGFVVVRPVPEMDRLLYRRSFA